MDDSVLTSMAIKELLCEIPDESSRAFHERQERKINPLGKPNTRFLGRTLTDAMHHNKRTSERTQVKSRQKLQELDYREQSRKYNAFYTQNTRERYERTEYTSRARKKLKTKRVSSSSSTKSRSPIRSRKKRHKRKHRKKKKKNKLSRRRTSRSSSSSSCRSSSRSSSSSRRRSSSSSLCSSCSTYGTYLNSSNRSQHSRNNRSRRSHQSLRSYQSLGSHQSLRSSQINQSRCRSLSRTSSSEESAPLSQEAAERIAPTTDYYYHSNNLALAVAMAYSQSLSSAKDSLEPASSSRDIIKELMSDDEVEPIVTINVSSHDDRSVCSTIDCESDSSDVTYECIDLDSGSDT